MYFDFMHNRGGGAVEHPKKHMPCAMVGALVAKRIHAIGTCAEHDVPCITFKIPIESVQRSPLASILDVSQLRIISIVGLFPLHMPTHELCFLGIYKITLQTGSDR